MEIGGAFQGIGIDTNNRVMNGEGGDGHIRSPEKVSTSLQ
ncbi:hypothetical protein ABIB56_000385 [Glaciihabitans sp. UYNi722]